MTIRIPASLSKIGASTLVSFNLHSPADKWGPAMYEYTVMEAASLAGMLDYGCISRDRIIGAEVLSTGRKVDITK